MSDDVRTPPSCPNCRSNKTVAVPNPRSWDDPTFFCATCEHTWSPSSAPKKANKPLRISPA